MRAAWIVCIAVAGCGTQSSAPFLLETTDCALVNNFTIDGLATAWNDCRVYWASSPTNILTVELTTPGASGSFVAPGTGWIRASVSVAEGGFDGNLMATPFPSNALPTSLTDQLALDMPVSFCGNLGTTYKNPIATMADVGDKSASFSFSVTGTCPRSGGSTSYSGGFIISAAAPSGSVTSGDPATVVTTP